MTGIPKVASDLSGIFDSDLMEDSCEYLQCGEIKGPGCVEIKHEAHYSAEGNQSPASSKDTSAQMRPLKAFAKLNPRQTGGKKQQQAAAVLYDEDSDGDLFSGSPKGKGIVSHSTVEKRRRDRINTLIDMLAEQVPPSSAKYGHGASTSVRRPKHTVLSDTLSLLSKIRKALVSYEEQIAELQSKATETTPCSCCAAVQVGVACAAPADGQLCTASPLQLCTATVEGEDELVSMDQAARGHVHHVPPHCTAELLPADPMGPTSSLNAVSFESVFPEEAEGLQSDEISPDSTLPHILVHELWPGQFDISIECLERPDLVADLVEGLGALPVRLDDTSVCPSPTMEDTVTKVQMQMHCLPGRTVTSEQLHLAVFMSVCCSCPPLPEMEVVRADSDFTEASGANSRCTSEWFALPEGDGEVPARKRCRAM